MLVVDHERKIECDWSYFSETHRENCFLLESVQEFIEIEAWLFLTFSICLHNQLNSIHSIVTY